MDWKKAFTLADFAWTDAQTFEKNIHLSTLKELKEFLDMVHIKYCLLKPYSEYPDYPLVETRELLPSFEIDTFEFSHLPGFSLVAFERSINFFSEIFQFDILHPVPDSLRPDLARAQHERNLENFLSRVPRKYHENVKDNMRDKDITSLNHYPLLMPVLTEMDRGQVMGLYGPAQDPSFYLTGIYASFPSDLDSEIKRYGLRIGKFSMDNPDIYEKNRNFVCQHIMELYGYPFSSERRTSAALFSRKLHRMDEKFLIRTVSQSDRTITTNWYDGDASKKYPDVEKIALISLDKDHEKISELREKGFFVNAKDRVVILKVYYTQHRFSPDNVRKERALSVSHQEIIHPLTGEVYDESTFIRDSSNMVLRLNDIVRGEHKGIAIFKRNEIIENTETDDKRLKFLYAWLTKHQRRMIGYSDEFFASISKVLDNYLLGDDANERFSKLKELRDEVLDRYSYIQQARSLSLLEDLAQREIRGKKISYAEMLDATVDLLHSLKFEAVNYFESLVSTAISIGENMLNDRYIIRTYIDKDEADLTPNGMDIRRNYGRLVSLLDELRAIRKIKAESSQAVYGLTSNL